MVLGTVIAPASLYVPGLVRKDAKMQGTALLADDYLLIPADRGRLTKGSPPKRTSIGVG